MATLFDDSTLYVLDSYGLIYREYFAFVTRPLTNPQGQNVSAVFGFFRNLSLILKKYNPKFMVAAFDSRTPTFRHEMYDQYKATRQKTPDDLRAQFPWIEDILGTLGIPVLRCDGFEADDVVATLAGVCEKEGRMCRILSADKDLMQLATDTTHILKPDKDQVWADVGPAGVQAEWGVPPKGLLDLLSLTGDSADNIPGVKGVGVKTACKLLGEYKTLDGIYEHADEIKGALGEKIRGDKENAYFSQKLIRLRDDVPCANDVSKFTANLNYAAAAAALEKIGVPAVAKTYAQLGGTADSGNGTAAGADSAAGTSAAGTSASVDSDAEASNAGTLPEPKPLTKNAGDYKAVTDAKELASFIDGICKSKEKSCALDTETDSLDTHKAHLVGFSLCYKAGTGIYVPLILTDSLFGGPLVTLTDALAQLARLFSDKDVTLVMHNGKFDLEVLWTNGLGKVLAQHSSSSLSTLSDTAGISSAAVSSDPHDIHFAAHLADTMVAAWLLEPDKLGRNPYSLEYLGETNLALAGTEYEDLVPEGGSFADVPLEKAAAYGAEDADFTWQLWCLFKPKLEKAGLYKLFSEMEMAVLPILAGMESRGIHLDTNALDAYSTELKINIDAAEKEIYKEVGHEFNIASTKQLQQVLFEERGLKPGKKTKTGYSTDTAVLEDLAYADPVPRKILEYRGLAKLLSTYVEALPALVDEQSRIHTSFMQTGTATGRLSSRDPNLQNIPVRDEAGRRIRSAFTAVPGTVLISADYAQIELVVLAHLSGDKNLCAAFNDGVDVHKATASLIYAVPPEQVTPEQRRSAKTINFGVMYGMSAFRLANELGITRTSAADFITNYFTLYSGVRSFIDDTVARAKETGYVETIKGRRRQIVAINSRNKNEEQGAERIAINTPIQGSAADIVKQAMIDVDSALRTNPTGARLLLQVHDELIFECPDNKEAITDTIALVKDKMEHAVRLRIPLRVSVEYGKNWGEFH